MYPDISYFFHDWFGTAPDNALSVIKTFGLFLAFAFLTSAWFLYLELKRKEQEGILQPISETITIGEGATPWMVLSNALFGFILGYKLGYIATHWSDFQADAAGVVFSGKGNLIVGIITAILYGGYVFWTKNKDKKETIETTTILVPPHKKIGDITMMAAISGIIGAKFFALFEDPAALFTDPVGQFFSGSGLAIYGGLIGGFIGVYWYIKNLGLPPRHIMDAVAPALIMGYAVGRLGCHFSGDGDWGIVNALPKPSWFFLPDWLWAYDYPRNVLNDGQPIEGCTFLHCRKLVPPVFPTPIYEAFMGFVIGGLLWVLRKKIKVAGVLFFIYMILNGIERFWIEKIRVNPTFDLGFAKATQAEIIAVLIIIGGILGAVYLWNRNKSHTIQQ